MTSISTKSVDNNEVLEAWIFSIFESMDQSIVMLDCKYNVMAFNNHLTEYFRKIFGTEIEVGVSLLNILPAQSKEEVKNCLERVLNGETLTTENKFNYKKDVLIWYETYYSPIKSSKGEILGISLITRDISERKRVEEALRTNEAHLLAIMDNSPALIHLKDLDGRYIMVNRQYAEKVIQKKLEDIKGKTAFDLFPAEIADQYYTHDQEAIASGGRLIVEQKALHVDGIHYYLTLKSLLFNEEGVPYAICGIATDITERKRADEEIRLLNRDLETRVKKRTAQLEKSLSNLQNALTDRILFEEQLNKRAFQQAAVANIGHQALAGANLENLLDLVVVALTRTLNLEFCTVIEVDQENQRWKIIAGEGWNESLFNNTYSLQSEPTSDLLRNILKNAQQIIIEDWESETNIQRSEMLVDSGIKSSMATPLFNNGTVAGVIAVHSTTARMFNEDDANFQQAVANVLSAAIYRMKLETELRSALEQEKELSELKSRFVTMTSHEFRTPLSTILASTELLEHYSHRWSEEKKKEILLRIQTSVKQMTDMLNDILLLGKADAGKLEFNPGKVYLEKFCQNLVHEIEISYNQKRKINFISSDNCGEVWLDEKLLLHILSNLLTNALKYSSEGSEVDFSLNRVENNIQFKVTDRGIGIPVKDQFHVFELFHRGQNVGTTRGTGLGLAIVKRSVDFHCGKIEFSSKLGEGTTFTVTLPQSKT